MKESSIQKFRFLKIRLLILCLILAGFSTYLILDYYGPHEIMVKSDVVMGMPVLRVENEELIVQEYDKEGSLWVTRGMWAYQMKPQKNKFVRRFHIPTGPSIFWLRNFSIIRRLTLRPECVELLIMPDGKALAMSAGRIWYQPDYNEKMKETFRLRHYGIGIGQGIRNDGWDILKDGKILFGEYFRNINRSNVRLFCSEDNGRSWQVAHEFSPGKIRHIHAIQQDPFEDKAWILAGDNKHEPMISWTDNGGYTLNIIGQGAQKYRATQLVFTGNFLFWGADTDHPEDGGIYRYDRKLKRIEKFSSTKGVVLYATRLTGGTIVMSTQSTKGSLSKKETKTRLIIIQDEKNVVSIVFGEEASRRKYAKLRFQRRQGNNSLVISVLNHKEYNNDLLIIPEYSLKGFIDRNHSTPNLSLRVKKKLLSPMTR